MNGNEGEQNLDKNIEQTKEEMSAKVLEFQEKVSEGLNKTMGSTAECLDKTASKMHKTAEFFRQKNADSLKNDFSEFTKKYPAQTLLSAGLIGFLLGKFLSR